jgi:hypothetical protein
VGILHDKPIVGDYNERRNNHAYSRDCAGKINTRQRQLVQKTTEKGDQIGEGGTGTELI